MLVGKNLKLRWNIWMWFSLSKLKLNSLFNLKCSSSKIDSNGFRRHSVFNNLIAHWSSWTKYHSSDTLDVLLSKMRVNFLLNFGDFIEILNANTTSNVLTWFITTFLETCCLLNEPRGRRWLNNKFEGSIYISLEYHSHWNLTVVLASTFIELLAELHHVDTKWTKCLTNLRWRLSNTSIAVNTNLCFISRACIHIYGLYIYN